MFRLIDFALRLNVFIFAALLTAQLWDFQFRSLRQSLQKGIVALQAVFQM